MMTWSEFHFLLWSYRSFLHSAFISYHVKRQNFWVKQKALDVARMVIAAVAVWRQYFQCHFSPTSSRQINLRRSIFRYYHVYRNPVSRVDSLPKLQLMIWLQTGIKQMCLHRSQNGHHLHSPWVVKIMVWVTALQNWSRQRKSGYKLVLKIS